MTETFLANKWLDIPNELIERFFNQIKILLEQIDKNIEENNTLTKQRDELLPLLMNGQVSVNYHLSTRIRMTAVCQNDCQTNIFMCWHIVFSYFQYLRIRKFVTL